MVHLMSFGYRYDEDPTKDGFVVLDARVIPNPNGIVNGIDLHDLNGLHPYVARVVLDSKDGRKLVQRGVEAATKGANVAVGCFSGRHRSVAVTEAIGVWLKLHNVDVTVTHRDLLRRPEEYNWVKRGKDWYMEPKNPKSKSSKAKANTVLTQRGFRVTKETNTKAPPLSNVVVDPVTFEVMSRAKARLDYEDRRGSGL